MHVSGMVAASYFARRCLADPTHIVVPNTSRGATREFRPRARPHIPHSARSAPAEFTTLHTPTPHAHSLRTILYLHASRLPFKHAFTFASAHAPESLHNCARPSRDAHLASSSLHYTQTAMFSAPSAPPSTPPRHHARRTGQITSASGTEHAVAERLWRARSAPTGQSLCESYFGITRVGGGRVHTTHERERWPAIVSGSRREWPHQITPAIPTGCEPSSIRRYEWRRQKARRDIATQSQSCVGPMMNVTFEPCRRLRTDEDWCRAPAVYCDNMERSMEGELR